MEINLLVPEKRDLELHHKKERDKRVADRIKAVLLKSEEWTDKNIAVALRIHEETVRTHLDDWLREKKLQGESGGSTGKLNHETHIPHTGVLNCVYYFLPWHGRFQIAIFYFKTSFSTLF